MENATNSTEMTVYDRVKNQYVPGATYRLQFNQDFTFRDARELVPYLHDLGITDVYVSPLFKPREGSTHGYDVVDYAQINPVLGSQEDFEELIATLKAFDMGLILDIVTNHMGVGQENLWWMDVMEHGTASSYAHYFDINWYPPRHTLEGKVLLPILEDHYGRVLEDGKLYLDYEQNKFWLYGSYFRLPINTKSYHDILEYCLRFVTPDTVDYLELESIVRAVRHLPAYTADLSTQDVAERQREERVIRRRFAELYESSQDIQNALNATFGYFNGNPEDSTSYDALDALITQQPYQLNFWRAAADEINYRRFFDINDMAAIRIEFQDVFDAVHQLVFQWLGEGKIRGLRVDHPDGLWNPTAYFIQLQEGYIWTQLLKHTQTGTPDPSTPKLLLAQLRQSSQKTTGEPLYVLVEKILSETEPLPEEWAVSGTTGYDFMIAVNNIFVNRDHVHAFNDLYSNFIGKTFDYQELIYNCKQEIMSLSLASELYSRSRQLARILDNSRRHRGFTLNSLHFALKEIVASLSIYRTYSNEAAEISPRDEMYLREAVEKAKEHNPRVPPAVFDFVQDILMFKNLHDFDEETQPKLVEFVMQFQQITGPVMAKSVEDTAFYVYNRLVSLNEVGGNPEQFGISLEDFHKHNLWHVEHWPHTMLGLSTHDTKRSEDVRVRLNVLSEIPQEWEAAIWRWSEMNNYAKTDLNGELIPARNDEYLLYQAMVGAWPNEAQEVEHFQERISNYMHKATNEAKVHTSWTNPDEVYQTALQSFIDTIFTNEPFIDDLRNFQRRVAYFGQFSSLSQTLLKLTSPGMPDTYQGNELWDFSLVDPDNRRLVDYDKRKSILASIKSEGSQDRLHLMEKLLENDVVGASKLYLIHSMLQFRRSYRDLFDHGDYHQLSIEGHKCAHVCAFYRTYQEQVIIVVAPVLVVALTDYTEQLPIGAPIWDETWLQLPDEIAGRKYENLFTQETVQADDDGTLPLTQVLAHTPVAVLHHTTT